MLGSYKYYSYDTLAHSWDPVGHDLQLNHVLQACRSLNKPVRTENTIFTTSNRVTSCLDLQTLMFTATTKNTMNSAKYLLNMKP